MKTNEFKIGDKVTFTRITSKGKSIDFKTLDGVVIKIHKNTGWVSVKYHGGRIEVLDAKKVRHVCQKNEITELVESLYEKK